MLPPRTAARVAWKPLAGRGSTTDFFGNKIFLGLDRCVQELRDRRRQHFIFGASRRPRRPHAAVGDDACRAAARAGGIGTVDDRDASAAPAAARDAHRRHLREAEAANAAACSAQTSAAAKSATRAAAETGI